MTLGLAAGAAGAFAWTPALAQHFPAKPVRIVCAFPPGNASDVVARIIAEQLSRRWGQSVYVENKPGASGILAAQAVQQAAPDGHTLLMTSTSFVVNNAVMKNVPYNVRNDFEAVSLINSIPVVLLVGPKFPANTMQEWLAEVKRNPGKYSYAHPGVGTIHNLTMKMLLQKTGTDILEVPYKGSVQALTDIMAGGCDMMFEAANSAYTYVEGGKLRALATSGPTRYYALPNVPTMKEAGIDISTVGFTVMMAPARTPSAVTDFVNAEVQLALKQPDVVATMKRVALELYPPMGAPAVQTWLAGQSERWAQIATAAHIEKE